jgi:ribosomal protein S12 methylthiotransferase accessory factor
VDALTVIPLPDRDIGQDQLLSLDTSLRSRTAAATLEVMAPYRQELQILDLVDHTLETIPSIPVYEAVRTSSPSGYFCLGKGFSHQASMASALMEAAEMALVEQPRITPQATLATLPTDAAIARPGWSEPKRLSTWEEPLDPSTAMLQGVSLIDGQPLHVPAIDLFYRPGWVSSKHGPSTNGLASGNTWNEALVHGLSELLESDALRRWMLRSVFFPPELIPLDADPSWDPSLGERLAQIQADGLHVVLTRLPCSHAVTVIEAQLIRPVAEGRVLAFNGWGCHADGQIATKRALAESVQILAMHVAIRDGRLPPERLPGGTRQQRQRGQALGQASSFERPLNTSLLGMQPRLWMLKSGPDQPFAAAPDCRNEQELLTLLQGEQLGHAFCVQVSPADWPMVALRSVAPALQTPAGL